MFVALYNNQIIAQSENTLKVEGNHYFPPQDVAFEFLKESTHHTTCPWKGVASYYHVAVSEKLNENAAWVYFSPKTEAEHIKGHIAFWKGVIVKEG